MARSLPDNLEVEQSLDKIARTDGTLNGASIDTGRDHFQRMVILDFGTWTDGTGKWTFQERQKTADAWVTLPANKLDDRDGNLDSVDLNSVNVIDATKNDTIVLMGLLSALRFVRVVNITTGSSTGAIGGANVTSGSKRYAGGVGQPMDAAGAVRIDPAI